MTLFKQCPRKVKSKCWILLLLLTLKQNALINSLEQPTSKPKKKSIFMKKSMYLTGNSKYELDLLRFYWNVCKIVL